MKKTERAYQYHLLKTAGMGLANYLKWKELGLSAEEFYEMPGRKVQELLTRIRLPSGLCRTLSQSTQTCSRGKILAEYEKLEKDNLRFKVYGEEGYPGRLYNIPGPPLALYYRGELPGEDTLNVAIIGARQCSAYGGFVAKELAKELAKNGITLISGMARGIDGISQEACVEDNGSVYAVLGSGADVCYPRSNAALYEKLCNRKACGVLSEYVPGTAAKASLFPPRNRIISGLSDVVVVVEACLKSGTLITVDMALEQGKEVYAVPGRVTDRLSDGCNKLIREGAAPFWSPEEFVQEILEKKDSLLRQGQSGLRKKNMSDGGGKKELKAEKVFEEPSPQVMLTELEKDVYAQCDLFPKSVDAILAAIPQTDTGEILRALTMLCLKGCITKVGGEYCRLL